MAIFNNYGLVHAFKQQENNVANPAKDKTTFLFETDNVEVSAPVELNIENALGVLVKTIFIKPNTAQLVSSLNFRLHKKIKIVLLTVSFTNMLAASASIFTNIENATKMDFETIN